jgi:hypothetical protein
MLIAALGGSVASDICGALWRLRRAAATAWPRPTVNHALQFDSPRRQDHERFHIRDESTKI